MKEKKDESKPSDSYAMSTVPLWWLQTGKISQIPMFYKGSSTKIPIWPAKWGCFATNIGWRFSLETRKEQEVNHILKVHFFLTWRMFLSQPICNAWQLLIYESLQQGFSSSCLLTTSEKPVAARTEPTGMVKSSFSFCKPLYSDGFLLRFHMKFFVC